jgi:hypothetical protein
MAVTVDQSVRSFVLHSAIDSALGPLATKVYYTANALDPASLPSVEAVIDCYQRGLMGADLAAQVALANGAYLPVALTPAGRGALGDFDRDAVSAWESVLRSQESIISVGDALELWVRGELPEQELNYVFRRHALNEDFFRDASKRLTRRPLEPEQMIEAFRHGQLSYDDLAASLKLRGVSADGWLPFIQARSDVVSPEQAIEYGRRAAATDQELETLLLRSGVSDPDERAKFRTLYNKLPSRADVTHWLMRNVFDQQYVTDFRLDEGFEDRYWARFQPILTAQGWEKSYAYLDYAAHWLVPAVGQLAEMVQRLRPGRVAPGLQFTAADFTRVLAEQDMAPFFRERLLATSYRPLPFSVLTTLWQYNAINAEELTARYQDWGFKPEDAQLVVAADAVRKSRQRATQSRGWTPASLATAYVAGQITPEDVREQMATLGYTPEETTFMLRRAQVEWRSRMVLTGQRRVVFDTWRATLAAFTSGTVSADAAFATLRSLGWQDDQARAVLTAAELKERARQATRVVAAVKKQYLKGFVTLPAAQSLLISSGLDSSRIGQLTVEWPLELTPARRHVSAGAIRKGLLAGILEMPAAVQALRNLGYQDPDAALLASEYAYDVSQQEVRLKKASDKQAQQASKLFEQLLKKNEQLRKQMQQALRRASPVSKLEGWYARGWVDEAYLRSRLSAMGYPSDVIGNYVNEANVKRDKLQADQKAKAVEASG